MLLVIEVADTSLQSDRAEKLPRYARAGIPICRIVDLPHRTIHRFSAPGAASGGYRLVHSTSSRTLREDVAGIAIEVTPASLFRF